MTSVAELGRVTEQKARSGNGEPVSIKHNHPGIIFLAQRLQSTIPEIESGSRVLSIGIPTIEGETVTVPERKNAVTLEEKNIAIEPMENPYGAVPNSERVIGAVIGNVVWDEHLSRAIKTITQAAGEETQMHFIIHPNEGMNGEFEDEEELLGQLPGLYVSYNQREAMGNQRWWEVDASPLPQYMPLTRDELKEQERLVQDEEEGPLAFGDFRVGR